MKLSGETRIANLTPSQVKDYKEKAYERAKTDPIFFQTNVLERPLRNFQTKMILHKGKQALGRQVQLTLLPRDSGKSWAGTIGDVVYEVCRNPNITAMIIAEALNTAMLFLGEVRQVFEHNTTLRYLFGDHVNRDRSAGSNWSAGRIVSKQRTQTRKEPTIECYGATGAIVGRHVDLHYLDDVVTDNTSQTEDQRDKLWRWYFKTLIPTLNQTSAQSPGIQKVRGTRYQPGDLYEKMIEEFGEDILFSIPALGEVDYEDYRPEHTDICPMANQGVVYRSYFPERYETGNLLEMKRVDPIAFESQYQNRVRLMLSHIIKSDLIKFVDESHWRALLPRCLIYIGVDPATGTSPGADYFATCTTAFDPKEFKIYVIRTTAAKLGDGDAMMNALVQEWMWVNDRGGYVAGMGLETNGFQQVLANTIRARPSEFGFLPIYPLTTQKDKVTNLISFAHYFNRGLVYFDKYQEKLYTDLLRFPTKGMRDDVIDAMMRSLQLIDQSGYGGKLIDFDVMNVGRQGIALGF